MKNIPVTGRRVKFGVLGDNHLASKYSRLDILNDIYRIFEKEKVDFVLNTGDIVDGEKMYRGQEYELLAQGVDEQVKYCAENYPKVNGLETMFILGNHPESFFKQAGIDIGSLIEKERPDMVYLGKREADLKLGNKDIIMRLFHPAKGTAYALSYQPQKLIESFGGGEKPNLLFIGHFHKAEYLFYRNVHCWQTGTTENQTPFMRERFIQAHLGAWVLDLKMDKKKLLEVRQMFLPYYD